MGHPTGHHGAATAARPDAQVADRLAGELVALEREARRVEAAILDVLARAEAAKAPLVDGHTTLTAWCRATVKWSRAEAVARVQASRLVEEQPVVADRLAAGTIGIGQVRVLGRARANPRIGDQLGDALPRLLEVERHEDHEGFAAVVRRWENLTDAEGARRDHTRAHAARGVWWRESGTGVEGRFRFGAAQGAQFVSVLDAFDHGELLTDLAEARMRRGDDPHSDAPVDGSLMPRTALQRRADALLYAMNRGADSITSGDVEPTVNIVIDEHTFHRALHDLLRADGDDPGGEHGGEHGHADSQPAVDPTRSRCETTTGIPVDPLDAVAAAFCGHVRRVVVNSAGVVIDLGRRSRLFTGGAREAVWLRRRTCLWPGCNIRWCDIDHTVPWHQGGATNPHNGEPLCNRQNRWKHRHGYRTWRDADGQWHVARPDGTEIAAA